MEIEKFDVAIIGLGPAGANLARLLAGKMQLLAIDVKTMDETGFHKPCGGLLAGDAQKALAKLSLNLPKNILVDPQIFSVKTIDIRSGLVRNYQRFYINLDRHKFDIWMKSLIGKEAVVIHGERCTSLKRAGDGFLLQYTKKGKEMTAYAHYVVGADGANSLVRKTFFPQFYMRSYVSIQQWFREENPTPFYSCIFDPENTDCYSWGISKDGYFIFGGAYPKKNSRRRFESQKKKLMEYGFRFGTPVKTEGCLVLRPKAGQGFCIGEKNIFLIGEAAGFISASSLEGISSALESSCMLSESLLLTKKYPSGGMDPNKEYHKRTRKMRLYLTLKFLKCLFLFHSLPRKLVMMSKIKHIETF